jgi:Malectin domain
MAIQAQFEAERLEVEALLASGIFQRAPNLEHVLTYVCSKYFDGATEQIKEYNIAVEALGRPVEFDQKRDSIVRVEAHRLRKRLREYYENEGAGRAIQIEIPSGQYAPRFIHKETTVQPAVELLVAGGSQAVRIAPSPNHEALTIVNPVTLKGRQASRIAIAVLAIGATAGLTLLILPLVRRSPASAKVELSAVPASEEIRVLAGIDGRNYIDAFSRSWASDRFFAGGFVFQLPSFHPISGTLDPGLYQTRREGTFTYDIPLNPGAYELRLHFAETLYGDNNIAGGGETSRIFQVSANGNPLLRDFDVIEDVGPSAADVKVFKDVSPASDGKLHLRFEPGTNPAFLNAIEIVPGIPGKIRPIRIVARNRGFTDKAGRYWDSDHYVRGGQQVVRTEPIAGTEDSDLYHGERFGNLTYSIPVSQPGFYRLTLYFAEGWFGPGRPGGGGLGSRVFDILCNGVTVKRNFDIFKEAGGSNRAFSLMFHHLEPNPQGKLVVSMIPRRNYSCINAIEIEEESN